MGQNFFSYDTDDTLADLKKQLNPGQQANPGQPQVNPGTLEDLQKLLDARRMNGGIQQAPIQQPPVTPMPSKEEPAISPEELQELLKQKQQADQMNKPVSMNSDILSKLFARQS